MNSRTIAASLVIITATAVAVRLHDVSEECLSLDEASSWRVSTYPFTPLLWHCAANVHPPGYFLVLKVWTAGLGDSPGAMRGLSVVFGVAAVGAAFTLAGGLGLGGPNDSPLWSAGLIAALFVALAPLQVEISRTARMYPLGVLCAALATWLLLRGLQTSRDALPWWLAWGAAAAAFCYVHYYAFFTLAGQAAFAAGYIIRKAVRRSPRDGWTAAAGLLAGISFAAALYSPWLPALYAQTREVSAGYWIEEPTGREQMRLYSVWFWGDDFGRAPAVIALALFAAAAGFVVRRRDSLGICFLVQAAAAWVFALSLSWFGPTSILQDRYFAFGQLFLYCLAGRALAGALREREQPLVAVVLASVLVLTGYSRAEKSPPSPVSSFPEAVRAVAARYRPQDVIAVSRPGEVNLARYYLRRLGADVNVRASVSQFRRPGHHPHLGSLTGADILWRGSDNARRYWRMFHESSTPEPIHDMIVTFRYAAGGDSPWNAVLYERR